MEDTGVTERVSASGAPTPAPSITRKILILWAIVFGVTLAAVLVCLRPLTEFILENSPQNYAQIAGRYLEQGEARKAAEYLGTMIHFLPPENGAEVYGLLARAWAELGEEGRRRLWQSRMDFETAWMAGTPRSADGLGERWDACSIAAASAARELGADLDSLSGDWIARMAEKMFFAKAKEGAPINAWIAGRTTELNTGLLLAGGAKLLVVAGGPLAGAPILLQSAGFELGKGAFAAVGAEALIDASDSGYHVVILNPSGGERPRPHHFDTYANRSASRRMAEYLETVPAGWAVLIVVSDEAAKLAEPTVTERALATVGIGFPRFKFKTRPPGYRESFVGVGVKGGKGECLIGDRWGRPATLIAVPKSPTIRPTPPPEPTSGSSVS